MYEYKLSSPQEKELNHCLLSLHVEAKLGHNLLHFSTVTVIKSKMVRQALIDGFF